MGTRKKANVSGGFNMSEKWKLICDKNGMKIHNMEGKDLSYNPNAGIQILTVDDYAFKDLNRDGILNPFEDWRRPMKERVLDFCERYHLTQKNNRIYYQKGMLDLPESILQDVRNADYMKRILAEDQAFLEEHYLLVVLLLMFDHDSNQNMSDYIIQLFIQSLEQGMLDKVFYSIKKAVLNFLYKSEEGEQLALEI